MRKILCSLAIVATSFVAKAQTISTFESLSLPKSKDTSYINYSNYGADVGFSDGLAYYPCVYDTSWGYEFWASGFSYSNWTDSVTSGFGNQYAAKTGIGFAASNNYAVSYGNYNKIKLTGAALGQSVFGFYITNSTYAYNSMRDGDGFSKKFTAADTDYFKINIYGYLSGSRKSDSVTFYLADFRNTDTTKNYIVGDWQWVDLLKLGKVDSLEFVLSSSDNGSFGMNTPAYFCIDNLITNESGLNVAIQNKSARIKIYPNPANNTLFVESTIRQNQKVIVRDLTGRVVLQTNLENEKEAIDISSLASGQYLLQLNNGQQFATTRFTKQ